MTQMLRQCVSSDQKDWAKCLPAIEFAMNCACPATTGYAPFMLNNGRMPQSMIWNKNTEFPGVRIFAQKMKDAIITAHDSILEAQVKQTRVANRRRKEAPFVEGDLVYLSTKNLSLPKGWAHKLAPKFVRPYKILKEHKNDSFRLDLPPELKQQGLHPSFHAQLLQIHVPNDNCRFPGRQMHQISSMGNSEEWAIDKIETHHGKGCDTFFKVIWKAGDATWMPYDEVEELLALEQYPEALGVDEVSHLPKNLSTEAEIPVAAILITPPIMLGSLTTSRVTQMTCLDLFKACGHSGGGNHYKLERREINHQHLSPLTPTIMVSLSNPDPSRWSAVQVRSFSEYRRTLLDRSATEGTHPIPIGYLEFAIQEQRHCNARFPSWIGIKTVKVNGVDTKMLLPRGEFKSVIPHWAETQPMRDTNPASESLNRRQAEDDLECRELRCGLLQIAISATGAKGMHYGLRSGISIDSSHAEPTPTLAAPPAQPQYMAPVFRTPFHPNQGHCGRRNRQQRPPVPKKSHVPYGGRKKKYYALDNKPLDSQVLNYIDRALDCAVLGFDANKTTFGTIGTTHPEQHARFGNLTLDN